MAISYRKPQWKLHDVTPNNEEYYFYHFVQQKDHSYLLPYPNFNILGISDSSTPLQISIIDQRSVLHVPVMSGEVQKILASILAAFGCSTKDLAEVLRVEKQTIYDWMNGNNEPDSKNSYRLRSIEKLAKIWNRLCCLPARQSLRIAFENELTLWNELCKENLNYHEILNAMTLSAQFINEQEVPKYKKNETQKESIRFSEYDMLALEAYFLEEEE